MCVNFITRLANASNSSRVSPVRDLTVPPICRRREKVETEGVVEIHNVNVLVVQTREINTTQRCWHNREQSQTREMLRTCAAVNASMASRKVLPALKHPNAPSNVSRHINGFIL